MNKILKKSVVHLVIISMLGFSSPMVAEAGVIGTLAGIEAARRGRDLASVNAALAREEVRRQLAAMGVAPADVEARLASLTDAELRTLAERIDSLPAGAGALEVLGIVFLVLLVLEAVGVIDIFSKFP